MSSPWPLTLYYDASCPLCVAEMQNLKLRDHLDRLRLVDCSPPDFDALPTGQTRAELMTLMHAQTSGGQVLRGVAAFELAYAAVGLDTVARLLRAPLLRPVADWLYPHIARHRQRMPSVVSGLLFGRALRQAAVQAAVRRCDGERGCSL